MATYLVTGGAGFIGSNIVEELVKRNEEVIVIDDLSTGKIENIKPFLDKITFYKGSINDLKLLEKAMKDADIILHQAAIPSVPRSIDNPLMTNNANITGTLNVLETARNLGKRRVVYAASSSAYGDQPVAMKTETLNPNPMSPYAIQKLTGEYYCRVYHKIYGLETIALRYFNVFGPRQDPNSPYAAVIPLFIKAVMNNEQPVIYGDGLQSRDFTYVANNVHAVLLAAHTKNKDAFGETINIALGNSVNLLQLLEKINKILCTDIRPVFRERRKGDVMHSLADISRAKKLLDYSPVVSFDEGLKLTIDYYKSH